MLCRSGGTLAVTCHRAWRDADPPLGKLEVVERIGPYRIVRKLGEGGMGVVYEAIDSGSGRKVALKTVRAASGEVTASLRREIHALRGLDHHGIVRVVADGVAEGRPWYAMEILTGASLRDYVTSRDVARGGADGGMRTTSRIPAPAASARAPEEAAPVIVAGEVAERKDAGTLREILVLVRELCAPLSYLHGRGIVHRDLKPENVLVREDGSPVIVDFGLTLRFGSDDARDSLAMTTDASGTISYLSPEQARGDVVDARSDLYALGCILFELVAGRPPFVGASAYAVLTAHAETEPPRLSECVDGIPPELDDLVLRMLAKEPRRRLGYADDVAEILERLAATGPSQRRAGTSYLYRPVLQGQAETLQQLLRLVGAAGKRQGQVVLVEGPAGSGKTRITLELARHAERAGALVILGDCPPVRHGVLWPIRPLLRDVADRCLERGEGATARLLGARARVLAAFEPALLALPGVSAMAEPTALAPEAEARRRNAYLADVLLAHAGKRKCLLVIDDLQWADGMTRDFLGYLARSGRLEPSSVVVVATSRDPDAELFPAVGSFLVPPLAPQELEAMATDMLAVDRLAPELATLIGTHVQGNPAALAELLRALVDDGLLLRVRGGGWRLAPDFAARTPAPTSPGVFQARRFHRLDAPDRRLCQAAAVLGTGARAALLAEMTGESEERILGRALALEVADLLVEDVAGRIRLAHASLGEVAYESVEEEARRELHRRAAVGLDTAGDPTELLARARHWRAAGDLVLSTTRYREAATAARLRHALGDAELALTSFLELHPRPSVPEVEARIELSVEVMALVGRREEARAEAVRAIASAEALQDVDLRARGLCARAYVDHLTGDLVAAGDTLGEALALAERSGSKATRARVRQLLGGVARHRGDFAGAIAHLEAARALSEGGQAIALDLAMCHAKLGRIAERSVLYESLVKSEPEDSMVRAKALAQLAGVDGNAGRWESARKKLGECLAIARKVGDIEAIAGWLTNLGDVSPPSEREGLYREALKLAHESLGARLEAHAKSCLADHELQAGRPDEAERLLGEALETFQSAGDRNRASYCLSLLGMAARDSGRLSEARERLSRGFHDFEQRGDLRMMGHVRWVQASVERYQGDLMQARRLAEESARILEGLGERVGLVEVMVERGHQMLAEGEDGAPMLDRIREVVRSVVNPEAAGHVERFARAVEAHAAGRRLLRGELPDDVRPALRRSLEVGARP